MGRGTTYTLRHYRNRILEYIDEVGECTTEDIMKNVRGTNHRLMDGLFYAVTSKIVVGRIENLDKVIWYFRDSDEER